MYGLSGRWLRSAAGILGLAVLLTPAGLRADDSDGGGGQGRAVRLSDTEGKVQLSQGGQQFVDQAVANTPLFEGTQVTTGDDGRAELQFEDGSIARIPPDSSVSLSVLQSGQTEVTVNSGLAYFEVQSNSGNFRIRFGNSSATTNGFTVVRIKLDQAPGELAVFSGNAHVEGDGRDVDLRGGESVSLNSEDGGQFNVSESIEPDSWDTWNSDRDQALTATETTAAPATGSNSNNPAWGDLNQNGTWYDVPDQGYVWSPTQASDPGWDPWGEGYWVWTPRYGYIWVSVYSWGYLPYQCGLWNWYDGFGWGWAPGPCNTWWAGGGGDWYYNVVVMPRWYKLPVRPGPPHPRPRDPNPRIRVHPVGPEPVIIVRRTPRLDDHPLPPRERGTPVLLGGKVAEPVLPQPRRIDYGRVVVTTNRPVPVRPPGVDQEGPRPGYVRGTGKMSGFGSLPANPNEPRQNAPGNSVHSTPMPPVDRGTPARPSAFHPTPDGGRPVPMPSRPMPQPAPSRPSPPPAPSRAPAPAPAPSHSPAPSSSHNK